MAKNAAPVYRQIQTRMPTVNVNWLARALPDPEDQRGYVRERVVIMVTEAIADAMETAGLRRTDIAERLQKSKGHISQVLSGRRNMTLHTLGDILWACGQELDDLTVHPLGMVRCSPESASEWFWQHADLSESEQYEGAIDAGSHASPPTGEWPGTAFETILATADNSASPQPNDAHEDALATAA